MNQTFVFQAIQLKYCSYHLQVPNVPDVILVLAA